MLLNDSLLLILRPAPLVLRYCLISLLPPQEFNASSYAPCAAECIFYKYNDEGLFQTNIFNLQVYNFLGFLWCINFVIALGQCVLAGAFASYYWAFKKPKDIPACAVTSSFIRTLRCVQPMGGSHILLRGILLNPEPASLEFELFLPHFSARTGSSSGLQFK